MSTLADEFYAAREVAFAAQAARLDAEDADRARRTASALENRERLLSLMRPAQKWEYEAWLTGYLKQGGNVTHFYDYAWPTKGFYVPLSDFVITPLYGATSVNVVVPKGVRFLGGQTGHCDVYITNSFDEGGDAFAYQGFHDPRPHSCPSFVPVFTDTEVLA